VIVHCILAMLAQCVQNVVGENTAAIPMITGRSWQDMTCKCKVSSQQPVVVLWCVFDGFEIVLQASDQASCL